MFKALVAIVFVAVSFFSSVAFAGEECAITKYEAYKKETINMSRQLDGLSHQAEQLINLPSLNDQQIQDAQSVIAQIDELSGQMAVKQEYLKNCRYYYITHK